MGYMTKDMVEGIVYDGIVEDCSHVLICFNHYDHEYFPIYIYDDENIYDEIKQITESDDWISIEEIYNYGLDLASQLAEDRAHHIEPLKERCFHGC